MFKMRCADESSCGAHLDMLPIAVGVGAAAVGAVLTPIIVPAGLSMLGFSAAGTVAGKPIPT
jgi:hypothetical protein